jgi:hypothetical protein
MMSLLQQELKPLNEQIESVHAKLDALEAEMRRTEAELESFDEHKPRYEELQKICTALDRLTELGATELFWDQLASPENADRHRDRLQKRISGFPELIGQLQEKQSALQAQIDARNIELDILFEQVYDAHAREQRRLEELVVDREISTLPERTLIMPWSSDSSDEKAFRRAVMIALLLFVVIGSIMHLVSVPVPERTINSVKIPERLAKLVKKEQPKPEPPKVAEKPVDEPKPEEPAEKTAPEKKPEVTTTPDETKKARTKAEGSGVLAFKDTFEDLVDETPTAGLGSQARLSKSPETVKSPGSARTSRSLVAIQGKSGSGRTVKATASRNLGNGGNGNADRISSVDFARVESSVADLQEETGRQVSEGPGPARTDEEIQIVFDRYKATLYRIYNKQLRREPTLRGKILLRLTIEPDGTVSDCTVEKTDLASAELVGKIVDRVNKFNFGPKEGVPTTTILYPIDFLPAG